MNRWAIVIMFLGGSLSIGCQSVLPHSNKEELNNKPAARPQLFQPSEQNDSSQGTALPVEPNEIDPSQVNSEITHSKRPKISKKKRPQIERVQDASTKTPPLL